MNNIKQEFEREALVLGEDAVIKLNNSLALAESEATPPRLSREQAWAE